MKGSRHLCICFAAAATAAMVVGCGNSGGATQPDASPSAAADAGDEACEPTYTMFINRQAGTYGPGPPDSIANTSRQVSGEVTLAPSDLSDERWSEEMLCLEALFAPYRIAITDVDPAPMRHVEVVVTSDGGSAIGLSDQYITAGERSCARSGNAVGFVFGGAPYPGEACHYASTIIGWAFGLDTVDECPDVMAYTWCEEYQFVDDELTCSRGACFCSGAPTQSSHAILSDAAGLCE